MTIPIDEMLLDLRGALEAFETNPCPDTFDDVQRETRRIGITCENELPEDDE